MSFRGESIRHMNVLPDSVEHSSLRHMFLWSSNVRPVKWTNSHFQCQLVGHNIDSDHERAMRNRLHDANTSEACIVDFRSESNLTTLIGMLWERNLS